MSLDSRPLTPDSQMANSLHRATSTIDDLTRTLSAASRLSSPEPDSGAACTCCCGREECESSKAWAAMKAKLESRLVLSAGACGMLWCSGADEVDGVVGCMKRWDARCWNVMRSWCAGSVRCVPLDGFASYTRAYSTERCWTGSFRWRRRVDVGISRCACG